MLQRIFNVFYKNRITFLNNKWEYIRDNVKTRYIPRINEYINFDNSTTYYKVVNVIHVIDKKNKYLIILEEIENKNVINNEDN